MLIKLGNFDPPFYKVGQSQSVIAYTYLILWSQASVRSRIIDSTMIALTAQKAFLNNFKNVVNHTVDIRENIKCYQDTLSYASSKVNYSVEEGIYMLPSSMNLNIEVGAAGYNNEILISNDAFSLGKNDTVNTSAPEKSSHRTPIVPKYVPMPKAAHTSVSQAQLTHEEERVLVLTSAFRILFSLRGARDEVTPSQS